MVVEKIRMGLSREGIRVHLVEVSYQSMGDAVAMGMKKAKAFAFAMSFKFRSNESGRFNSPLYEYPRPRTDKHWFD